MQRQKLRQKNSQMPKRTQKTSAQRFDLTLKQLFQTLPSRLIELVLGAPPIETVTIELPHIRQRRADLAYRLPDGKLHQFELQSDNDEAMDARMLEYYAFFWRQDGQPPVQHVLYVGNAPLRMRGRVAHPHLQFSYEVIDIRTFDPEQLLASEFVHDNLLAVLCRNGATPAIVQRILRRIRRLPKQQQMDHLERLLILSNLRKADILVIKEAREMEFELDIEGSAFFSGLVQKGKVEGEAHLLRRQLEHRFGPLPEWAERRLKSADLTKLERWSLRLLEAERLEQIIPKPRNGRARAKR